MRYAASTPARLTARAFPPMVLALLLGLTAAVEAAPEARTGAAPPRGVPLPPLAGRAAQGTRTYGAADETYRRGCINYTYGCGYGTMPGYGAARSYGNQPRRQ